MWASGRGCAAGMRAPRTCPARRSSRPSMPRPRLRALRRRTTARACRRPRISPARFPISISTTLGRSAPRRRSSWRAAANGGNLYRKTSFLLDSLGKPVFSPLVCIEEKPLEPQGSASTAFDEEGVATRERVVVNDGVLEGYFLGSYAARKLGMQTTGNAGGSHNLVVRPGKLDFRGMLREMGTGLLVTELLGQGINLVTGDYSRGAAGYWVEGGEIRYPVEEITIAGNLRDIFKGVAAVGGDVLVRSGRSSGSILIDNMTIAGD